MTVRHLSRLLLTLLLVVACVLPAFAAKKKAVKKKVKSGDDYEQSKYRAYKELSSSDEHSYRFDQYGNPISADAKKKKPAKKKKKDDDEAGGACGAGEACQDEEPKGTSGEGGAD